MGIDVSIILRKQKTYPKPFKAGFPHNPKTIGDHLKKKRMELGLPQSAVAKVLKVSKDCITFWEKNRSEPQIHYYPRIVEFLGYHPLYFDTSTIIGRMKAYRYENGLSQKRFAKLNAIDPCTIRLWEEGKRTPSKKMIQKLELLLTNKPLY